MSSTYPERVDPWSLCAKNRSFEGRIPLGALPRLRPLLSSAEGDAAFTLIFALDEEKRSVVRGSVDAVVDLICQRCMKPMPYRISEHFALGLVPEMDEAAALPDELDPLWVENDEVAVADIIADELILAVPVTPRHIEAECEVRLDEFGAPAEVEPERKNPFAVLESLKRGKTDS